MAEHISTAAGNKTGAGGATVRLGVACMAKDETVLMSLWIQYYLGLGFTRVIVYDNGSAEPISGLVARDFEGDVRVIVIDWPRAHAGCGQREAYTHAIQHNTDLDWILLCDADEFLWQSTSGNVHTFLATRPSNVGGVVLNWLTYGTSRLETLDASVGVFDQCVLRGAYGCFWNRFFKTFVRPLPTARVHSCHYAYVTDLETQNIYGETITPGTKKGTTPIHVDRKLGDDTPCVLVHYMTLSYQDMDAKFARNHAGKLLARTDPKYSRSWYAKQKLDKVEDRRMCRVQPPSTTS